MKFVKHPIMKLLVIFLLLINFIHCHKAAPEANTGEVVFPGDTTFLNTYVKDKPRLILTKAQIQNLKAMAKKDTLLNKYVTQCVNNAKNHLSDALPVYSSAGILTQSQDALNVITTLSFAYLWTGEKPYAEKAKQIILAVSA